MKIEIATFAAKFRVTVRHSSATRTETENVVCRVTSTDGNVGVGEGCPRSYVTGETVDSATAFLREHSRAVAEAASQQGVAGLSRWIGRSRTLVDENPAAFAAIEIALIDLLGQQNKVPVEDVLDQPRLTGQFQYTAVLGDSPSLVYSLLLHRYLRRGFRDLKLKLSGDLKRDQAKVRRLAKRRDVRVRFDANNLWANSGSCIDHLSRLDLKPFAVEEPLHVGDLDGFAEVAAALDTRIVLDESALRPEHLTTLPSEPEMWIINCRVSKMGGLLRSLETTQAATDAGVGVIVGAQVGETSILTRAALPIAASCSGNLVGQEGAFGTHLLRHDLTEPVVMFDRSGTISTPTQLDPSRPGLGLKANYELLTNVEQVA